MATYLSLFICVFVVSGSMAAIPGGLKGCKQSSADYSKCLIAEVQKAVEFFKSGNKKLGVSSINPMKFDKMLVDQGTGPVAIKLEFTNSEIIGLSNLKVTEAKNDWKTLVLAANIYSLSILGDYTISGKVLVLPISGTGKSNITMVDTLAKLTVNLKEINNNGKPYTQAVSVDISIKPKQTFFNLQNLFNGDKALGDNMNKFLNENHEQIVQELNPAISRALSRKFGEIINQVFAKIPLKEIKLE